MSKQEDTHIVCENNAASCCICTNYLTTTGTSASMKYLYDTYQLGTAGLCDCSMSALESICMECFFRSAVTCQIEIPQGVGLNERNRKVTITHKCHLCSKSTPTEFGFCDFGDPEIEFPDTYLALYNLFNAYLFEGEYDKAEVKHTTTKTTIEFRDPDCSKRRTIPTHRVRVYVIDTGLYIHIAPGLRAEVGCCGRFCKTRTLMVTEQAREKHCEEKEMGIFVTTQTTKKCPPDGRKRVINLVDTLQPKRIRTKPV